MGRKRTSKDQPPDKLTAALDGSGPGRRSRRSGRARGAGSDGGAGRGRGARRAGSQGGAGRPRRGRKLALLVALAGAATYLVRRNQRKAELDEGIWHEAPASAPTAPASTA